MTDQVPGFVFLGSSTPDSAGNKLKASSTTYVRKRLDSGAHNWADMDKLLSQPGIRGVVARITADTYARVGLESYSSVSRSLFAHFARLPSALFAHEAIMTGVEMVNEEWKQNEEEDDWYRYRYDYAQRFPMPTDATEGNGGVA